jgi:hypothetical protein
MDALSGEAGLSRPRGIHAKCWLHIGKHLHRLHKRPAMGGHDGGLVLALGESLAISSPKRWTVSAIVTFPQAQRWALEKNPGSENSSARARVTISCDVDGDAASAETNADDETPDHKDTQGQSDGMTMFLWHQTTGTTGLEYSKILDQRGSSFAWCRLIARPDSPLRE